MTTFAVLPATTTGLAPRGSRQTAATEGAADPPSAGPATPRPRGLSGPERAGLVFLAVALAICALASRPRTPDVVRTASVRVCAGDTLWGIAQANQVAGLTTAQTAQLIATLNGLGSSSLAPGRTLQVPAPAAIPAQVAFK